MNKKIISIILAIVMIIGMLPMTAFATQALEETDPHTHGDVTFTSVSTFEGLKDLFENGGSGYLAADIVCTEALTVSQDVDLCLNGKMLNLNQKGNITVTIPRKFNLYDCGNTVRNWDIDATGLWVPAAYSTTNSTIGGVITGGSADKGGGVSVGYRLNMYGGNIVGNTATADGGGVYILGGGTAVINGGNIIGNTAANGGGVWMDNYDKLIVLGGSVTGNTATEQGGGIYYKGNACLAKGTMITLADGTRKPVEELDTGDDIRVFDHDAGTLSNAKISDYWHYGEPKSDAFTLHFSNGINVTAVTAHSFYEKEENRYVSLNTQNAEDYIGHFFYNADADRWETLESVTILNGSVETYLVATEKHLDCITEGMLSCEDDIYTVFRNVFAFDKNMMVDKEQKAADIVTADGLWSYEDCPLFTKESFDALNLQYAKVAVNKGMISFEDIEQTALYCSILDTGHFENNTKKTPLTMTTQSMLMNVQEESSSIDDFTDLTFGGNAQVKGNFLKNEDKKTANNIYLTSETVINLATGTYAPTNEMLLYVSIEADGDSVPITGTAGADDIKYFKSDDPAYGPVYDTENSLINLEKVPAHTHSFAEAWSYNETGHWHACTADGCNIEDYSTCGITEAAYGVHDFTSGECVCGLKKIAVPTAVGNLIYNGDEQTGVVEGTGYTLEENTATFAGEYTAIAKLADGYIWSDLTTEDKNIIWSIAKKAIDVPTVTGDKDNMFFYTGNSITALENSDYYAVTNETKTEPGKYTAEAYLNDTINYKWATDFDGKIEWYIVYTEYYLTKAPTLTKNGNYNQRGFYMDGNVKQVVNDKLLGDSGVDCTFQEWYLRTAFQVKTSEQGDGVDIRLISFLDGEYESYTKAGFTIAGVGSIETTYVYETLIANGEEVDITDLGVSDYAFVITTSFSKSDVIAEKTVEVTPFVVKDGSIYTGETYTLKLGELKSFIAE